MFAQHKYRIPSVREMNAYIDKLAWILVSPQHRKLLVARSFGKTAFFVPGGKRETGESDHEALIRECREELTVCLRPETIRSYGVFQAVAHGKPEGTMVRMTCYTADYDGEVKPNEEIEEVEWINSSFARGRLSVATCMILDDLKQKEMID